VTAVQRQGWALAPPIRDRRFWFVQGMVVALAVAHLTVDAVSPPGGVPAGIPVALLLLPVSYAALHFGLAGSTSTALWATLLWVPDLLLPHDQGHVGNDLIELALVLAVAIFVGRHIDGERLARARSRRFPQLLIDAQEEERRRIAQELHDEPLQLLVQLARLLEAAGLDNPSCAAARQQALDISARIRTIVAGLRPAALTRLGLVTALRGFLADVEAGSGLPIELEVVGDVSRLGPECELGAFRIIQEAVNNAVQHAAAKRLMVTIAASQTGVRVTVVDDGHGFEIASPDPTGPHPPLGILGMRERAELLGGGFEIRSAAGRGTTVTAFLPGGARIAPSNGQPLDAMGGEHEEPSPAEPSRDLPLTRPAVPLSASDRPSARRRAASGAADGRPGPFGRTVV
jgi:signal transduction histidine kinase